MKQKVAYKLHKYYSNSLVHLKPQNSLSDYS